MRVVKKGDESNSGKDLQSEYQKMPLYFILLCGLILSSIGLYLITKDNIAIARSLPNKYGEGGGQRLIINGQFTLFAGIVMAIFPTYQLIKQALKKP